MLTKQCQAHLQRTTLHRALSNPRDRQTPDMLQTQALPLELHWLWGQVAVRPEVVTPAAESPATQRPSGKAPQLQSGHGELRGQKEPGCPEAFPSFNTGYNSSKAK